MAGGPTAEAIGAAIDALEVGDFNKAEVASLKALTLAPDEPHALALLAEIEMRQGHQANALKYLQTAVAKNPKSAVAEEAMGRYLDENKEYPAAESAFKKAIVLDAKWAAAQISLGDFYLQQGKSGPAFTAYRAAVEVDPKNGAAHLALGLGMAAAGGAQNSEKELRTAARLMPNSARPLVALGNLLSLKGRMSRPSASIKRRSNWIRGMPGRMCWWEWRRRRVVTRTWRKRLIGKLWRLMQTMLWR